MCFVESCCVFFFFFICFFFCQAEDGIRYLVRSRGLGDVYKRQGGHQLLGDLLDLVALGVGQHWVGPGEQVEHGQFGLVEALADRSLLLLGEPVSYTHLTLPTSDLV